MAAARIGFAAPHLRPSRRLALRETDCQLDRLDQADGIGDALAGDVERGAVIDRRADDRQPQRDVDRPAERHHLDGNQPLVVIARDRPRRTRRASRATKTVSAGNGPATSMPRARRPRPPGRSTRVLFAPDEPVLAGVRIEPGEREPRRGNPNRGSSLGRQRRSTSSSRSLRSARAARRRAERGRSPARRAAPPRRTSSPRAARRSGAPAAPCAPSTGGPPAPRLPC